MGQLDKSRFYSDFNDSIFQRSYYSLKKVQPLEKWRRIGKLRFDTIFSKKLILNDTHILDGLFFLDEDNDPLELIKMLNRGKGFQNPLEIRARDLSLATTLSMFVKRSEKENLQGFSFSGLYDPNQRKAVSNLLEETPSAGFNDWQKVLALFKLAEVDQENILILEKSWSRWIEAQNSGLLNVVLWDRPRGFPIREYAGSEIDFLAGLKTEDAISVGKDVYEKLEEPRSRVVDLKFTELKQTLAPESGKELIMLEAKYHRAYNQAAGWQYNCGSIESTVTNTIEILNLTNDLPSASDESVLEDQDPRIKLETVLNIDDLDRNFLYKLGTMPDSDYENFFWINQTAILNWWNHSNLDSLKRVADKLVRKASDLANPTDIDEPSGNKLVDFGRIFLNAASEVFTAPIKGVYTLFSGVNDISIKYAKNGGIAKQKQLAQRIVDIVKERGGKRKQLE